MYSQQITTISNHKLNVRHKDVKGGGGKRGYGDTLHPNAQYVEWAKQRAKIRTLKGKFGITFKQIAQDLGVDVSTVQKAFKEPSVEVFSLRIHGEGKTKEIHGYTHLLPDNGNVLLSERRHFKILVETIETMDKVQKTIVRSRAGINEKTAIEIVKIFTIRGGVPFQRGNVKIVAMPTEEGGVLLETLEVKKSVFYGLVGGGSNETLGEKTLDFIRQHINTARRQLAERTMARLQQAEDTAWQ